MTKDEVRAWCHGGQWYVEPPDGIPLRLNSEDGVRRVKALFARIAELEAQQRESARPQGGKVKRGEAVGTADANPA